MTPIVKLAAFPKGHFTRYEFACKCGCGYDTVDAELLVILNNLREFFDAPVTINSACRCPAHNASVGGSEDSQHLYARAADVVVENIEPDVVYEYLDSLGVGGLGKYKTFTHVDTRINRARW
jgi:uncharacterized protein YcbK (DUF882 family)